MATMETPTTGGIQIRGLTRHFGAVKAVDDLYITVAKQMIYGLVGPDGAGKTTTMRMLCSLISPDSGTATIAGLDIVSQTAQIRSLIGYMPQKFSLYGDLTVRENLEFYAEIYQTPQLTRAEKLKSLLEFSNLTNHSTKLADQLSGGMKQKLALACNLIHTPQYLFLDEPTIGVDPVARRELWKILFELRDQGATIFVSTPYMDEAERCDVIGLMDQGRIITQNPPETVIQEFDRHILEIRSDNNHRILDLLPGQTYIEDAYLMGEELHLVTADAGQAIVSLQKLFKESNITVETMAQTPPSLEDVFVHQVKRDRMGGALGKCN
ncbi:MAG: ABC transporter ATP-binding protein [Clostridiaceae bacterium]